MAYIASVTAVGLRVLFSYEWPSVVTAALGVVLYFNDITISFAMLLLVNVMVLVSVMVVGPPV